MDGVRSVCMDKGTVVEVVLRTLDTPAIPAKIEIDIFWMIFWYYHYRWWLKPQNAATASPLETRDPD